MAAVKQPGRRRVRNTEATRRRILDAAERLFVARGFAGVSIRDVAAAAKVGTSLVMHHAGSKARLWTLVKEHAFAGFAVGQEAALRAAPGTPALLDASLRSYFAWLRDNPRFLRLVAWRDLAGGDRLSPPESSLLELGRQRMREAREAGWLHPDIDPDLALFAIFAMLEGWFINGRRVCFAKADDPAADDRYLDTVLGMLHRGLIARIP